ncbi:type II secretion system secretin GspD [Porticoccus sp. W117]|uniref:type II secretion system secretin GspD n=1 Tax=Porticoccus sp. W117 TaxID=3054777 RepID=UPI0025954D7D|nr:type II secretion system secretin GspD [Porticoccus sp. W117]MDM3869764.1 type II secretion system secretin GspD [Porticoccus sp. W117]
MRTLLLAVVCTGAFAQQATTEKTWTPNFRDADIREVIHFVSATLGAESVIIDPLVKGKVDVISRVPLNQEKLYDLFVNVLDVHGFAAINSNGVLRVIPAKKARTAPASANTQPASENGFVTRIIELNHVSAAKVLPILRPMVPQHAHLAASTNGTLVISDTAANVRRIERLIRQLDKASKTETELVELHHAHAEELVTLLEKLNKGEGNANNQQKQLIMVAESRTNSILLKGDQLSREEAKNLIRQLDRPGEQTGNIRTFYLQHANAESLAEVLSGVISNLEQGQQTQQQTRSAVVADVDTNSLIITAQGDTLDSLLHVVKRLDIRRSNVIIEAVIAEVNDTVDRNLGIEWVYTDEDRGTFGSSANNGGGLGALAGAIANNNNSSSSNDDDNLSITGALAGIPGQTIGVGRVGSTVDFAVVLNALHNDDDSTILAKPHLITLDNSEAIFNNGQQVPFLTGSFTNNGGNNNSTNPFQTIQREDVGIRLEVTPHINNGGSMELEIYQEVSSISNSSAASDLITNKRDITATVRVDDGEMIVLSGLIRDDLTDNERKVPLLGDIPLLGRLFRSTTTQLRQTNLMVFIRARILHDEQDTYDFTAEKYDFIRQRQLEMQRGSSGWLDKQRIPVLPEWQEPRPQAPQSQSESQQPEHPDE